MRKAFLAIAIMSLMAAPAMAAVPSSTTGGGVNTGLYHSYDGLICTDCHTLHGSEDGAKVNAGTGAGQWTGTGGFQALLKKGDYTDMCLSCHKEGFNTSSSVDLPGVENSGWTAPIVMTLGGTIPAGISMPAGDFYQSSTNPKKGHNPAYTKGSATSTSKLMSADSTLGNTPPGGALATSANNEWSCHSCHGMHDRFSSGYTAWRQLQRKINGKVVSGDVSGFGVETATGDKGLTEAGYEPIKSNSRGDIQGTNYVAARKDGNALQGADLFAAYGDTNKNVYQGGFSSFCSACHGDFHGGSDATRAGQNANVRSGDTWIKHPTNMRLGDSNPAKYGVAGYTKAVTNAQGNNPNPSGYDWKYPLVKADADFTTTRDTSGAVTGDDRIMCLTCHKAHASQYENMTRWDTNGHAFIANGATDHEGQVSTGDNPVYGCGKCHQKGGATAFKKSF